MKLLSFDIEISDDFELVGITQKKLMESAEAPEKWREGKYREVMDYCLGDCQMTNLVVLAIQKTRQVQWVKDAAELKS